METPELSAIARSIEDARSLAYDDGIKAPLRRRLLTVTRREAILSALDDATSDATSPLAKIAALQAYVRLERQNRTY